jgi:hypothetical protein
LGETPLKKKKKGKKKKIAQIVPDSPKLSDKN